MAARWAFGTAAACALLLAHGSPARAAEHEAASPEAVEAEVSHDERALEIARRMADALAGAPALRLTMDIAWDAVQRGARCVLLAAALLAATAASANGQDLTRLLAEFGSQRERHARFVERRFSALSKSPLQSSGTLTFRAPDFLHKVTLAPQRESVQIEGQRVTVRADALGTAPQTFNLSDAPPLAALIDSLRATLSGDLAALRRNFEIDYAPGGKEWRMTLTPRERAVREAVAKIDLRGAGPDIATIEIVDGAGDLTLLALTPLPAKRTSAQ